MNAELFKRPNPTFADDINIKDEYCWTKQWWLNRQLWLDESIMLHLNIAYNTTEENFAKYENNLNL